MSAWKISGYRLRKNKKLLAIVLGVFVLLMILGGVMAAYVWKNVSTDNQMSAYKFYLTLDLLGDTNEDDQLSKTVDLYGGNMKNFQFKVQNYFDSKRISTGTSYFTVAITTNCSSNATVTHINGLDPEAGIYNLNGSDRKDQTFNVAIPAGYADNEKVVVTVSSTKPYLKTMTITIRLHTEDASVSYYVEDSVGAPYAKLYVLSTVDIPANGLEVTWASNSFQRDALQIDMTNSYFIEVAADGTLSHKSNPAGMNTGEYLTHVYNSQPIGAGGSVAVMFFKKDPSQDYSLGDEVDPVAAYPYSNYYSVSVLEKVN